MLVTLLSPILELQHAPLPSKVLQAKERAPIFDSSVVFTLDSHLNLSRSLGVCHIDFEQTMGKCFHGFHEPTT